MLKPHLEDHELFAAGFKAVLLVLMIGFGITFLAWAMGHDVTWRVPTEVKQIAGQNENNTH